MRYGYSGPSKKDSGHEIFFLKDPDGKIDTGAAQLIGRDLGRKDDGMVSAAAPGGWEGE